MTTIKNLIKMTILGLGIVFFYVPTAHSAVVEVTPSTFTGDFSNGGEYETNARLLGNASNYNLGFIQNNQVKIQLSSTSTDVYGTFYVNGVEVSSVAEGIIASTTAIYTTFGYVAIETTTLQTNIDNLYLATISTGIFTTSSSVNVVNLAVKSVPNNALNPSSATLMLAFTGTVDGVAGWRVGEISYAEVGNDGIGALVFKTDGDDTTASTPTVRMSVNKDGVMIDPTGNSFGDPDAVLKVVGDVKVGSITAYGTITSSTGFVGDGSGLTNVTASGVGGSTFPVLTHVLISSIGATPDLILFETRSRLGNTEMSFSTIVTMSLINCGGVYPAVASANTWYRSWLGYNGSTFTVLLASHPYSMISQSVNGFSYWLSLGSIRADKNAQFNESSSDGFTVRLTSTVSLGELSATGVYNLEDYIPPNATSFIGTYTVDGDPTGNNSFNLAGYGCVHDIANIFGNNGNYIYRGYDIYSNTAEIPFCGNVRKVSLIDYGLIDTFNLYLTGWREVVR